MLPNRPRFPESRSFRPRFQRKEISCLFSFDVSFDGSQSEEGEREMASCRFRTGAALALAAMTGWGSVQAATLEEVFQIDEGFKLFTTEKFAGNGRTCSTCHLPERNYTISPADILSLPSRQKDLVFAKKTPGLENAKLVSKFALFNIGPGNANAAFPVGPFRTSMTMAGLDLTVSNCRVPPPFSPSAPR